jgi:hypothetical protein
MYGWSPLPRNLGAALRDVQSPKARVRLSAVADLARWADGEEREQIIAALVRLLGSDPDLEVQAAAALALADVDAVEGLPALIAAAETGAPRLCQMSLLAIGELAAPAHPGALEVVRTALDSGAPALRFQALVAAHRLFEDGDLQPRLSRALGDVEAKVRYIACRIVEERYFSAARAAAAALPAAASPDAILLPAPGASLPAARAPLPAAAGLLDAFAARLSDSDPGVALAAAVALAGSGSEPARSLLVAMLNRPARGLALEDEQAAIELCAELGLTAARPGLAARAWSSLWGGTSPLAFQARVALARLGDARAQQQILRALSAFRRTTRLRAVAAAGQARLQAARPRLLEMSEDERQADPESVALALRALEAKSCL